MEGGSLRGALQPCRHVARGTEGVAVQLARVWGKCALPASSVRDCVQCRVLGVGKGARTTQCASDVDEMASNDPS